MVKFICNIFGWDIVKKGIIRIKVQFSVWIENDGLFKYFFYMLRDSKFIVYTKLAPTIYEEIILTLNAYLPSVCLIQCSGLPYSRKKPGRLGVGREHGISEDIEEKHGKIAGFN